MRLQCGTNDNHRDIQPAGFPVPRRCSAPGCAGRMRPPAQLARLRQHARQETT